MVYVEFRYTTKDGERSTGEQSFRTKEMALRFMYKSRSNNMLILSYRCDDPYDNEWLERRFRL